MEKEGALLRRPAGEARMAGRNDREHGAGRVLRLVAGVDPTGLNLTAQEGFLLSRIDGRTDWELLVDMTGMDIDNAQRCRDDWLATGIVEWQVLPRDGETEPFPDADLQRRVLEIEPRLAGSYHEQLGVEPGADDRAIKKAYFELSRQFHPDRFFRCDLGPYAERVSLIFKTIQEAYKVLSQPGPSGVARDAEVDDSRCKPANLTQADAFLYRKLERLSQREIHSLPRSVLEERRQKAQEFMQAARISERDGRLLEAIDSVRMAIRFEPGNVQYRIRLANLTGQTGSVVEGGPGDLAGGSKPRRALMKEGGRGEGPIRG